MNSPNSITGRVVKSTIEQQHSVFCLMHCRVDGVHQHHKPCTQEHKLPDRLYMRKQMRTRMRGQGTVKPERQDSAAGE